jgi:hypothetical protein
MQPHADSTQMYMFWAPLGLAVGAVLLVSIGALVWMLMRHSRKNRELLHMERMKALEMGQPAGLSEPDKLQEKYAYNAFWIAFWVGAGVPAAAVWAAAYATTQPNGQEMAIAIAIWSSVTAVSIPSVVCATVLMVSARRMPMSVERTGPRNSVAGEVH